MRVIAGTARGRRLKAPPGAATRPTSDRVREALFSSLAAHVPGARVLDLYSGSGALGIEALSRGAASAVLVERDARAAAVIAANLERTGLDGGATVLRTTAASASEAPTDGPFDLVLVDPPYAEPLADVYGLLSSLRDAGGLAPGAWIVIERDKREAGLDAPPPPFLVLDRRREYGDTMLLYLRSHP